MNRKQLQTLAKERLKDAKALVARKRWAAAYYLTGYVVECALKSCVLRYIEASGIIFKEQKYLSSLAKCWTHDLEFLVTLAGLDADFGAAHQANPALKAFWDLVKSWKETSRYEEKTEADARTLLEAVDHDPDGVFRWIQSRW